MIVFVGDVHAQFKGLEFNLRDVPKDAVIIQVGDFGVWPDYENAWDRAFHEMDRAPIYFIDGNHEYHPWFKGIDQPEEIFDGAIYVPRGHVMELDGLKIGFLGGASSVDKSNRSKGIDWFPEEITTQADGDRLLANAGGHVDVLVTHSPPAELVPRISDPRVLEYWDLGSDWADPSATVVQDVWDALNRPPMFCGHFHKAVLDGDIRVCAILECVPFNVYEQNEG